MELIASSTFSQLSLPLRPLYKLCPLQSSPFHCHPTHSICPPLSIINLSILNLSPADLASQNGQCFQLNINGQCLLPPPYHIVYTSYLLFSPHATFPATSISNSAVPLLNLAILLCLLQSIHTHRALPL